MATKFIWDKTNIHRAQILAKTGYTATEAAAAMGTTRSSLACRASRKKEFRFTPLKPGFKIDLAAQERAIVEARALIDKLAPRPSAPPPGPAKRPMKHATVSARSNQPQVCRANALVEKPLNQEERIKFLADEGANEYSKPFSEMETKDCKWIVDKDEFGEAVICGKRRKLRLPYCEAHAAKALSTKQPRPINAKVVQAWDQSTKPVAVTK